MPDRQARRFLLALVVLSLVLLAALARPLLLTLMVSAVFASTLFPIHERLQRKLHGRQMLSAILVTIAFSLVVLLPIVAVIASVANDIVELARSFKDTLTTSGLNGLIDRAPSILRRPIHALVSRSEFEGMQLEDQFRAVMSSGAGLAQSLAGGAGVIAFKSMMMLLGLATFLIEGPSIVSWLRTTLPMSDAHLDEILGALRKTSHSIVVADLGTGAVQTAVALVGFLIAGAPSIVLATFATFVCSLIPGIGAAAIVCLVAALLLLSGSTGFAIFLAIWGVALVGLVDNLVRPFLMRRGADMHGALSLFAIVAGLLAFGAAGFIVGPLVVAFSLCVFRIWSRDMRDAREAKPTSQGS